MNFARFEVWDISCCNWKYCETECFAHKRNYVSGKKKYLQNEDQDLHQECIKFCLWSFTQSTAYTKMFWWMWNIKKDALQQTHFLRLWYTTHTHLLHTSDTYAGQALPLLIHTQKDLFGGIYFGWKHYAESVKANSW